MRASAIRGQAGFTLVELMVAMSIFLLILVGIFQVFDPSHSAYQASERKLGVQQNARVAMEQMVREIRQAGYDPCRYTTGCTSAFDPVQPSIFPIQAFSASSIWVRADRNANGSTGDADESVCFYRDGGGVLRRKTTGGDCSSGGEELARNITSFTLTYLKADGSAAATWSEIKLVRIAIAARETFMGSPLTVGLQSDVRLRDR